MKHLAILSMAIFSMSLVKAQDDWPKVITASDGTVIKVYQPQPESFSGDILKFRAAFSLQNADNQDPVFGTFWSVATVETDRDARRINILSAKVPNLKLAADTDVNRISYLKTVLESEIPQASFNFPLDQVLSSLEMKTEEKKLSKDLNNNPPKIIYTKRPSILVLIDGEPKLQHNDNWGVDAVVNTPFTIVKNKDGNYYLYGGKRWYAAPAVTGPYHYVENIPGNLRKVESAVNSANNNSDPGFTSDSAAAQEDVISDIVVSTEPAELIQSKGEPTFAPVQETSLEYVSNTDNDIFRDTNSGDYYVLLSGRWYKSPRLNGNWQYVAASSLPADFAKIPEGSSKDNVLASVAGTDAAREAVMDAQIPQTAKVDRKNATADVTYDGDPQFQDIQGTDMQYAINTPSSVIRYRDKYYCVENGVWFESDGPNGPWVVSVQRPDEVDIIPPSNPMYNLKYVNIYDSDPNWVYTGYTPGYLNAFIYGPTVVYGTGFYYRPWRGSRYYPRPYTWGFSMRYNPWSGWGMGYDFSYDWFNIGFGFNIWDDWCGGWWGPSMYHPAYSWGGARGYGYYGRNAFNANRGRMINNRNLHINSRYTNNIYNYRRDAVVNNVRRPNGNVGNNSVNRGGGRVTPNSVNNNRAPYNNRMVNGRNPAGYAPNRVNQASPRTNSVSPSQGRPQANNVITDREGNVYQRNGTQWQQRQQGQWKPVTNTQRPEVVQNLNRQQQMMDRGQVRTQNFQAQRSAAPAPRASNGGGRPSGGGGGGRRGGHR
jgi:hypothetical protein